MKNVELLKAALDLVSGDLGEEVYLEIDALLSKVSNELAYKNMLLSKTLPLLEFLEKIEHSLPDDLKSEYAYLNAHIYFALSE